MTRITNLGKRKATHLEATKFESFNLPATAAASVVPPSPAKQADSAVAITSQTAAPTEEKSKPKNKKRKTHSKKKKRVLPVASTEGGIEKLAEEQHKPVVAVASDEKKARQKTELQKAEASNARRLARIRAKAEHTVCFACRETGHAAMDCSNQTSAPGVVSAPAAGKDLVGVCYRCGSFKHSLSRCKVNENPDDKMPYASCFVCGKRGHLASMCGQNKTGIYPQGGNCKLCGSVEHLARNCALSRKNQEAKAVSTSAKGAILIDDIHKVIGADDDDFHMIERRRTEMEREEKVLRKLNKLETLNAQNQPVNAAESTGRGVVVDPGRAALHGIEGQLAQEPSKTSQIEDAVAKVKKSKPKVIKF